MIGFKKLLALMVVAQICSGPEVAWAANPLDIMFLDLAIPFLEEYLLGVNKVHANQNGTRREFRNYLLEDESNEDMGHASVQDIIDRAGFHYETHTVESTDGYITQMIRIVNPLVEPSALRRPPVMLLHGGIIDPHCWIWASISQHHPERYPRRHDDEPMTSWNRSLAFTLANNGYDVWLVASRGSNEQNQGHAKLHTNMNGLYGRAAMKIERDRLKYWRFSMEEVVANELPVQIDRILDETDSKKLSIVALSVGTMTTLTLLATNPKHASKVHSYVSMGTPITQEGANRMLLKAYAFAGADWMRPDLGALVFTDFVTTQVVRNTLLAIGGSKRMRYSLIWAMINIISGPTPAYQTNIEPAFFGHILQPTGCKLGLHFCQQVKAGQLQRYDYGKVKNLKFYGQVHPPAYDMSNIKLKNWMIVTGANDMVGNLASAAKLIKECTSKPEHLVIDGFNHIDLVAGMDNDIKVNLPILQYLNRFHHTPKHREL